MVFENFTDEELAEILENMYQNPISSRDFNCVSEKGASEIFTDANTIYTDNTDEIRRVMLLLKEERRYPLQNDRSLESVIGHEEEHLAAAKRVLERFGNQIKFMYGLTYVLEGMHPKLRLIHKIDAVDSIRNQIRPYEYMMITGAPKRLSYPDETILDRFTKSRIKMRDIILEELGVLSYCGIDEIARRVWQKYFIGVIRRKESSIDIYRPVDIIDESGSTGTTFNHHLIIGGVYLGGIYPEHIHLRFIKYFEYRTEDIPPYKAISINGENAKDILIIHPDRLEILSKRRFKDVLNPQL